MALVVLNMSLNDFTLPVLQEFRSLTGKTQSEAVDQARMLRAGGERRPLSQATALAEALCLEEHLIEACRLANLRIVGRRIMRDAVRAVHGALRTSQPPIFTLKAVHSFAMPSNWVTFDTSQLSIPRTPACGEMWVGLWAGGHTHTRARLSRAAATPFDVKSCVSALREGVFHSLDAAGVPVCTAEGGGSGTCSLGEGRPQ